MWLINRIIGPKLPPNLVFARVSGAGRSETEAAEKAINALDFLRGIWNFTINWGSPHRWSTSPHPPINRIRLGPIHTLHDWMGKLATNTFWYESNLGPDRYIFDFKSVDWGEIKKTERWLRSKLLRHRYDEEMTNAFIRYSRSLDSRDLYATYLALWGVLEFLTAIQNGRYKDTARRTAFLFDHEERDYHYEVLRHLIRFRNRRIHADAESSEIETLTYQLKGYVEALINFHLHNHYRFDSIGDAGDFLQLPYKLEDINDRIQRSIYARRFRFGK